MTDKELRTTQYIPTIAPFLDREKLIKALDARYYALPNEQRVCDDIISYIKVFRGADANVVEVVRCKDCKHRGEHIVADFWFCEQNAIPFKVNDFCSYGEKRESK